MECKHHVLIGGNYRHVNASCHVNDLERPRSADFSGTVVCVVCGKAFQSSLRRLLHPPPSDGSRVVRDIHVAHVNRFQDSYIDSRLFIIVMESKNFDLCLGNGHTQSRYNITLSRASSPAFLHQGMRAE